MGPPAPTAATHRDGGGVPSTPGLCPCRGGCRTQAPPPHGRDSPCDSSWRFWKKVSPLARWPCQTQLHRGSEWAEPSCSGFPNPWHRPGSLEAKASSARSMNLAPHSWATTASASHPTSSVLRASLTAVPPNCLTASAHDLLSHPCMWASCSSPCPRRQKRLRSHCCWILGCTRRCLSTQAACRAPGVACSKPNLMPPFSATPATCWTSA